MNKILAGIISILTLAIIASPAMAAGFSVDKDVVVTGDWKWEGGHWNHGEWATATYKYTERSPGATNAYYVENEKHVGTPWKYSLKMDTGANDAGWTKSVLNAWTVNDPVTTPATGGYTHYAFVSQSDGEFTHTHLNIHGQGEAHVSTTTHFTDAYAQYNHLSINHQL